jgi:hypothetical protein
VGSHPGRPGAGALTPDIEDSPETNFDENEPLADQYCHFRVARSSPVSAQPCRTTSRTEITEKEYKERKQILDEV